MEKAKKTGVQKIKWRQTPRKTVLNSQCVIFTYFHGDVGSMVDAHFSRALKNLKKPQGSSSSSHSDNVVPKNGEHVGREEAFTQRSGF